MVEGKKMGKSSGVEEEGTTGDHFVLHWSNCTTSQTRSSAVTAGPHDVLCHLADAAQLYEKSFFGKACNR